MLMQPSSQLSPQMRFASAQLQRAALPRHTPDQNRLLAALPPQIYQRLLPALEPVHLPHGWTVHGAGDREDYLYFLTAGIVARLCVTRKGPAAAFAVTGNEGAIGVASFLGGVSAVSQAVALSDGYAYRLRADLLQSECGYSIALLQLLLRYTHLLIAQTGQTAACNRLHSLEQQLCRWILSCLDRSPSNELTMTQHLIADMLGVRRESVTEAARHLQKAGLIDYSRGHIAVLERSGVQARACECYGVVRQQYNRLFRSQTSVSMPARTANLAGSARHFENCPA
jgi:CRP-like cAMP-binding protein